MNATQNRLIPMIDSAIEGGARTWTDVILTLLDRTEWSGEELRQAARELCAHPTAIVHFSGIEVPNPDVASK